LGQAQQEAFEKLKDLLCQATVNPLNIVDFSKPYNIPVDTSNYMVGAVVSQSDENGVKSLFLLRLLLLPARN